MSARDRHAETETAGLRYYVQRRELRPWGWAVMDRAGRALDGAPCEHPTSRPLTLERFEAAELADALETSEHARRWTAENVRRYASPAVAETLAYEHAELVRVFG